MPPWPVEDSALIGRRYGSLTVTHVFGEHGKKGHPVYRVVALCDCGTTTTFPRNHLDRRKTCGYYCPARTVMKNHPLYSTWKGMIKRCHYVRPGSRTAEHYRNKNIRVCERWRGDFWQFVEDMGPRPEGYVIDRIDPDRNYTPDNCRWVTPGHNASRVPHTVIRARHFDEPVEEYIDAVVDKIDL